MSRIMQFNFQVPRNEIDFKNPCIVETQCRPLYRPREMMQAVNHGGQIKIHMLVDADQPERLERFLIIGTGHEIAGHLVDSLRSVGHLLMNDGQFGIHVYHIEAHPEAGQQVPKKAKLTVEFRFYDHVQVGDMMEFSEMINVFFSRWKDQVVWDKGPNGGEDPNKIHILNDSVVRSDAFAEFKERLYQAPVVKTMKIIKLV
jgi:hypothetical protein